MMKIIADMHCHTIASSHAYNTIMEMARTAKKRELMAIAITDHAREMPGAPHPWFFENMKALPRKIEGVNILKGIEANVIDTEGHLDEEDWFLEKLEWVVASIHSGLPDDIDACTNAWMQVAKNPYVRVIGHSGTVQFPYDYERVVQEFGHNGKLVEINTATFYNNRRPSIPNCARIVRACKKYGVPVIVNSDAHVYTDLGKFEPAVALLEENDFPKELVVNADEGSFRKYIKQYCGIDLEPTYLNMRRGDKIVAKKKPRGW